MNALELFIKIEFQYREQFEWVKSSALKVQENKSNVELEFNVTHMLFKTDQTVVVSIEFDEDRTVTLPINDLINQLSNKLAEM